MRHELEGRRALVTGASRGLGEAIARAFVDAGAEVVVAARPSDALAGVADALGVTAVATDLAVSADAERLVEVTEERLGQLDVVVNNAGIFGPMGRVEDCDWSAWVDAVRVNLFACSAPPNA